MQIVFTATAAKDFDFWRKSGNKIILKKIDLLIQDTCINPFSGLGKPEPLKHQFAGWWSKRINQEHRMVYEVKPNKLIIHGLKGHY